MCLIFLAWQCHPHYPLIVAANRDEFHQRPTAAAHYWPEQPTLLAGRDLQSGGTWLGMTTQGRWAALTNYREGDRHRSVKTSRGALVRNFLRTETTALEYVAQCQQQAAAYDGYNLLVSDGQHVAWYSNRAADYQLLRPGLYGLSNHLLDTPWFKVQAGKAAVAAVLQQPLSQPATLSRALFQVLADRTCPPDDALPETGVSLAWERLLASRFIVSPSYGTRSATVILQAETGVVHWMERSFQANGNMVSDTLYQFVAPLPNSD